MPESPMLASGNGLVAEQWTRSRGGGDAIAVDGR